MRNTFATQQDAIAREAAKDATARGEDWVYILNHAAACSTLDILNTPIEMWTQKHLGYSISVSNCAACKSGEHNVEQHHAAEQQQWLSGATRWFAAEMAGDWLGAVPTIMVQRHLPFVTEGIGRVLTYVAGDFFYAGAKKDAEQWGKQHGFAVDSEEVKGRTKEIYTHEMEHISQAAIWTGFSTGIALGTLKLLGDDTDWKINAAAKLAGVSTSFFGVLGMRAANPELARSWDRWGSEHIAKPLTRILGKGLGFEHDTVEKVLKEQDDYREGSTWVEKAAEKKAQQSQLLHPGKS